MLPPLKELTVNMSDVKEPKTSPSINFLINEREGSLPYIPTPFPAPNPFPTTHHPRLGMARWYTMRSIGTDSNTLCRKEDLVLPQDATLILSPRAPLPRLLFQDGGSIHEGKRHTNRIQIPKTNYIHNCKSVMRMRGFEYQDVYSINRNRREEKKVNTIHGKEQKLDILHRERSVKNATLSACNGVNEVSMETKGFRQQETEILPDSRSSIPSLGGAVKEVKQGDKSKPRLPPITSQGKAYVAREDESTRSSGESVSLSSTGEAREPTVFEKRFTETVGEYETTPGWTPRKKNFGRKLGNVVSSQRLSQLLESKEPLRMENFYNYYP